MAVVIALAVGGWFVFGNKINPQPVPQEPNEEPEPIQEKTTSTTNKFSFNNQKKSAHFETSTPSHGDILAGVPINVVLNFNFDLGKKSTISIKSEGKEYGVGEVLFDNNKLSVRKKIDPNALDGLYSVSYNACWPDGSCHDGSFEFAIDSTQKQSFMDLTNQKEVTIKMSEIMFNPQKVLISKGTKVTWVNDDQEEHYVNTDSHPGHSYYPTQNSKILSKGDKYSVTFSEAGIYPYHCSAHTSMTAQILVI